MRQKDVPRKTAPAAWKTVPAPPLHAEGPAAADQQIAALPQGAFEKTDGRS